MFTVPEAGGIVNMGLILGEKHNFIVDTGMGESNVKGILEYIGDDSKPIIVINTHADWDHIFGNSAVKDRLIVAHVLCRNIIDANWGAEPKEGEYIRKNRDFIDSEVHKCLPNLVFEGSLHFPDDGITVFHSPGHTEDSISVYDATQKVLYIGDNFAIYDGVAYLWTKDLQASEQMIENYKPYDFDICIMSHSEEAYTGDTMALLEAALKKAQEESKSE